MSQQCIADCRFTVDVNRCALWRIFGVRQYCYLWHLPSPARGSVAAPQMQASNRGARGDWIAGLSNRGFHRIQVRPGFDTDFFAGQVNVDLRVAVDRLYRPFDAVGAATAGHPFYLLVLPP